jgi:hypothetical protein
MDCPICGAVAENITSPGFDGLGVRRHNCKDFDVADPVLNKLLRMDIEERTAALEKAKALGASGEQLDRPALATSFQSRRSYLKGTPLADERGEAAVPMHSSIRKVCGACAASTELSAKRFAPATQGDTPSHCAAAAAVGAGFSDGQMMRLPHHIVNA